MCVCVYSARVVIVTNSNLQCGPASAYLYRGTSIMGNSAPRGPYSRNMSRALWRP